MINTYIKIKFKIIILIKLMIYPKIMENMTTKQIHFSNNSIDKHSLDVKISTSFKSLCFKMSKIISWGIKLGSEKICVLKSLTKFS